MGKWVGGGDAERTPPIRVSPATVVHVLRRGAVAVGAVLGLGRAKDVGHRPGAGGPGHVALLLRAALDVAAHVLAHLAGEKKEPTH